MRRRTHPLMLLAFVAIVLQLSIQTDRLQAQEGAEIATTEGTLVFKEAKFSDRFPVGCTTDPFGRTDARGCLAATAGYQLLIVLFEGGTGVGSDIVDQFYVTAGNGSRTSATQKLWEMGGSWTLVFSVRASADGLKLVTPDNEPIELTPERER